MSPTNGVLRIGDDDGPGYRASGEVVQVEHLAFLVGFSGTMKPGDMELIYGCLAKAGARVALARRLCPHRLPYAKLISHPLLGDWFAVDLQQWQNQR